MHSHERLRMSAGVLSTFGRFIAAMSIYNMLGNKALRDLVCTRNAGEQVLLQRHQALIARTGITKLTSDNL